MILKVFCKLKFILIALFFSISLFSQDSQKITIGIIANNDRENYSIPYSINRIIPMLLNLAINDVKKEFPKAQIKTKYFYFQKESTTSRSAIEAALNDKEVQLVFGPLILYPILGHSINR